MGFNIMTLQATNGQTTLTQSKTNIGARWSRTLASGFFSWITGKYGIVWPEKARRTFIGKVRRRNFGVRSAANGMAARSMVCTFAISARRRTAACIYMPGLGQRKN
jgi:hypothetical protein